MADAARREFDELKATVPEIVAEAREGRPVILVDDEDRENEGDFVLPAQFATPAHINLMATLLPAKVLLCSLSSAPFLTSCVVAVDC